MSDYDWAIIREAVFIDIGGNIVIDTGKNLEVRVPGLDVDRLLDIIDTEDGTYFDDDDIEVIDWDAVEATYEDGDAF